MVHICSNHCSHHSCAGNWSMLSSGSSIKECDAAAAAAARHRCNGTWDDSESREQLRPAWAVILQRIWELRSVLNHCPRDPCACPVTLNPMAYSHLYPHSRHGMTRLQGSQRILALTRKTAAILQATLCRTAAILQVTPPGSEDGCHLSFASLTGRALGVPVKASEIYLNV